VKALKMGNILQIAIKCVTFVLVRGLNYCKFQNYLKLMEVDFGDVIYFSEVKWLSRYKMHNRFQNL